ncbi:MAG: peptidoglycan editing factor PgeF [Prevotella sp.]|nr:peptidoglycan editing factor PgeF [Prevotella sp.]
MKPRLQYYEMGEGIVAFSTTRQGGYSQGAYGEFNVNRFCGDCPEHIAKNHEALCQLLGIASERLLMPHQVHLTNIAVVDEEMLRLSPDERRQQLDGFDALMTNQKGVCIGVSTADCIPVLLCDTKQPAVCAVHAGWRGTVQRIVEAAVAKMTATYGSKPENLVAQIGPGIHLDSFEVGDEVYETFLQSGFDMQPISRRYPTHHSPLANDTQSDGPSKWHIDLPECNRLQLLSAGVLPQNIRVSPTCTFQHPDTFFSARRLGINSGRILSGIMLNA